MFFSIRHNYYAVAEVDYVYVEEVYALQGSYVPCNKEEEWEQRSAPHEHRLEEERGERVRLEFLEECS